MEDLAARKEDGAQKQKHCYVKLPVFEGPFDLLYSLVSKEELDLCAIPLAEITRQYLAHLQSMQELEIEVAGEFLLMAASLLYLKSRLLLPQPSPYLALAEEGALLFGSKEELVRSLLAYKRYKKAAALLQDRLNRQEKIYLRAATAAFPGCQAFAAKPDKVGSGSPAKLKEAWRRLAAKNQPKPAPPKINFFTPKTSLVSILRRVALSLRENTLFNSYLDDFGVKKTKEERISIFTLFLELARRSRFSLAQAEAFGRIRILKPAGKGRGTDVSNGKGQKAASGGHR